MMQTAMMFIFHGRNGLQSWVYVSWFSEQGKSEKKNTLYTIGDRGAATFASMSPSTPSKRNTKTPSKRNFCQHDLAQRDPTLEIQIACNINWI